MKPTEIIPDFLLPFAKEVRFRFSKYQSENKQQDEVTDLEKQWEAIINKSEELIEEIKGKDQTPHILFWTGYGVGAHFLTIEPIVLLALKSRGCKITSITCGKALPACEFNMVGNNEPKMPCEYLLGVTKKAISQLCDRCVENQKSVYRHFPIDKNQYGDFLSEGDYQDAWRLSEEVRFEEFRNFVYNDIAVGEEAFASILRVTFKGTVDDTPRNRLLARRYIYSGILIAKSAENAFRSLAPDRVVMIHGVYLTHGISTKVAHKLNIPSIVMGGGGIRKDTVVMCHGETYHRQLVKEPNTLWENAQISDNDRDRILDYANQKKSAGGGADYLNYHPNPLEDADLLLKELNIDRSREIVSVYTNVIWDAQIFYDCNAFKDIFDWLFTTISLIGKNKNVWGVVRIHPAEKKGALPTKQPMEPEIRKRFPVLPDNVRIISPESDISSYTLGELSRASIIYGTKMGLELALMKIPLIICGETFSRNKGYGLDITSRDEYEKLIANIHEYSPDTEMSFERALRYANYFYFRKMLDLPFTTLRKGVDGGQKKIDIQSLNDLLPGKNKNIDLICDGIMNQKPFYLPPSS